MPQDLPQVTVQRLAKRLGQPVDVVLKWLLSRGAWVSGPNSVVSPSLVRQAAAELRQEPATVDEDDVPDVIRRYTGGYRADGRPDELDEGHWWSGKQR